MTASPAIGPESVYRQPERLVDDRRQDLVSFLPVVLAAVGDLAVFYAVLELVLRREWYLVSVAAVGTTAVAVALAHAIGAQCARIRAGDARAGRSVLGAAIAAYVLIGVMAVLARLAHPVGTSTGTGGFGAAPGEAALDHDLVSAAFFAALYLGSGAFAAYFGYHHHNPFVRAHRAAERRWRKAAEAAGHSRSALISAEQLREQHLSEHNRENRRWEAARRQAAVEAADLQNYVRVLMARHTADPSATDGLTRGGPRPDLPTTAAPEPEPEPEPS